MEINKEIKYSGEVFKKPEFNNEGKQYTFQCGSCGKWLTLQDLRYFGNDEDHEKRICIKCLDEFQKKQKELAREIKVYLSNELSGD